MNLKIVISMPFLFAVPPNGRVFSETLGGASFLNNVYVSWRISCF